MTRYPLTLLLALYVAPLTLAQSPQPTPGVVRDAAALVTIGEALKVAGEPATASAIQDFTGNGQITYFWAGKEVTGDVIVRGRSTDQFRLDATLPSGTRSWAVNRGTGILKEADGKSTPIPTHNAVTLGSLTFPLYRLNQAIVDNAMDVTDQGLVPIEDQQFHKIHIHKNLLQKDPDGFANRVQSADLFFDPKTSLLLAIQDQTHPVKTMTIDVPRSLYFSDYRPINGVLVPFSISEYVGGQKTWSVQLTDVKFNTGLTDADFQL